MKTLIALFEKKFFRDSTFLIALLIVMGNVRWDAALNTGPCEPHLWRQSDCVSITQYYAKGAPFFEPEMHCRLSDNGTSGKTVAEFPIIYYVIGKIWSVTGTQYWIYRLFNGLFCLLTMILLYRSLLKITGVWFWSALGPFLIMASPIYAFYGISFLTNIPALNCVIIAWYCILRYYHDSKMRWMIGAVALFTMAGLLKVSSLNSFFVLIFVFLLDWMKPGLFRKEGRFFQKPVLVGALLLMPLVIGAIWYLGFVEWYCNLHGGRYSFTSPMPFWNSNALVQSHIWKAWFNFTYLQIYPSYVWLFFIGVMLFIVVQFRKFNLFWVLMVSLTFFCHVAFSMLFFFCLDGHDYYHIDLLIFFIFAYAALAKFISQREKTLSSNRALRLTAFLCVVWINLSCAVNIKIRSSGCYFPSPFQSLMMDEKSMGLLSHYQLCDFLRNDYDSVAVEMTRRGFDNNTVIIAANDPSFNSLLLRMDRPGFTGMSDVMLDSSFTAQRISHGAELLIVTFPDEEKRGISKFFGYPLFHYKYIWVYDLRPYKK